MPKILFICLLCFCLGPASLAVAQNSDDFRTFEYMNMGSLDNIGAAEAYTQGFTGKGVVLGIADVGILRPTHSEFAGKQPYGTPWGINNIHEHATHVAGIAAAARDNQGMHGVAFDASLLSLGSVDVMNLHDDQFDYLYPFHGEGLPEDFLVQFLVISTVNRSWLEYVNYPDVKIINASTGFNLWSDTLSSMPIKAQGYWHDMLSNWPGILEVITSNDKLMIISSGNEGHASPAVNAALPDVLQTAGINGGQVFANNYIAVGAYDPEKQPTDLTFISPFSNMGQTSPSFILAPGSSIFSATDSSDNSYTSKDGTSMAAPHVTGVAGLVSQAFPYMGGKQIADVILSTATPMDRTNRSRIIMLCHDFFSADGSAIAGSDRPFFYSDDPDLVATLTEEEKDILRESYLRYSLAGSGLPERRIIFNNALDDYLNNYQPMSSTAYGELFGHGLLNAAMAVRGPGYLDARRLDETRDYHESAIDGNSYAMYAIDSRGYDSIWSNNIGQQTDTRPGGRLENLDVGLHKQGQGMLYLSGVNTFKGPTIIDGGGIVLSNPNGPRAELASSYVLVQGMLTGDGILRGDLYNQGQFLPGLAGEPGSHMRVDGNFRMSQGDFYSMLYADGSVNNLQVGGNVNVSGGNLTLLVQPTGGSSFFHPHTTFNNIIVNGRGNSMEVDFGPLLSISPFISFTPTVENNSYSLRNNQLGLDSPASLSSEIRQVAHSLQGMFNSLQGQPWQERMYFLFFMDEQSFSASTAAMRGDLHAASIANLPLANALPSLLWENPAHSQGVQYSQLVPYQLASNEMAIPLAGSEPAWGLWIKPLVGYTEVKSNDAAYQDSAQVNSRGLLMGVQRQPGAFYYGLLAGVGDNSITQYGGKADINDFRLGLYGGWQAKGWQLSANAAAGLQHYKTRRNINLWNSSPQLRSTYDGYSFSAGAYAAYNLLHGHTQNFELKPYLSLNLDYIHQEGRSESGDDLFALNIADDSLTRSFIQPGLAFRAALHENLSLDISAGYKRIMSGHSPGLEASFVGGNNDIFYALSPAEGKDFLTLSFGLEASIAPEFKIKGMVYNETSGQSSHWFGSINLAYEW